MDMSGDPYYHQQAAMEDDGVGRGEQVPAAAVAALSAKKLWRMVRAVHLVLVRGLGKHQPKLAALGVNLHHLMSSSKRHHHQHHLASARDQDPAFTTYLTAALSCRSMDPGAVVHPYQRGRGAHSGRGGASSLSSTLSCRSMDSGAAVYQQYQYRPREVEFSCSSTPLHRRHRRAHRHWGQSLLPQQQQHGDLPEYSSVPAVKTLFELMDDVEEEDDDDAESAAVPWAARRGTAPRQVRITDSPFPAREEDDEDGSSRGVVDRRADEFIVWFHDQLRMQQQQQRPAARDRPTYLVR